jgi:apocytochrome f
MRKSLIASAIGLSVLTTGLFTAPAHAWPSFAAGYDVVRDSAGKVVCANCHLGKKPTEVEFPSSVMPGEVFPLKIKVPYDTKVQEVGADGSPAKVQIGAYIELPEGFRLADEKEIPAELKNEYKEEFEKAPAVPLYADKPERNNELIINQVEGDTIPEQEFVVPVKAPDPGKDKINFGKYTVWVGANRGRGQVYSNGTPSNNTVYNAPVAGTIAKVETGVTFTANLEYGKGTGDVPFEYTNGTRVTITGEDGKPTVVDIPPGPKVLDTVKEGTKITAGQPLTNDPNIGGFAAEERDIVLQDPQRVAWLLAFLGAAFVCQVLLVLKKKQVEKVQELEAEQQGI